MLIGEVVRESGFTRDTIRYYERRGLIEEPTRRDNSYKDYADDTVRRLQYIKKLQRVGYTLREAGEFLELHEAGEATCANVGIKARAHLEQIDERIQELQRMREELIASFDTCRGNPADAPCTAVQNALEPN